METPPKVPHFTGGERAARGKAARAEVPRALHAEIEIPGDRDPVALLEEQAVTRVPELVPIRYGRMLASAFAFYRGGALIMATDLARTPNSSIRTQLCGDAHLSNFGMFGSPERNLVFDINDFDETAPGPWEWDVKRLAASFAIAGRENGFSQKQRETAVLATIASYREAMAGFAAMRNLEVWYASLPVEQAVREFTAGIDPKRLKKGEANLDKARTRDSMQAYEKLTHLVDGEPRIISDPPLIVPIVELLPRGRAATGSRTRSETCSVPTGARWRATCVSCSSSSASSTSPARWSGSEASAPAPDRPLPRRRRPGPALPPGQGGPAVGAGAVRGQEPVPEPRPARGRGQRLMQAVN